MGSIVSGVAGLFGAGKAKAPKSRNLGDEFASILAQAPTMYQNEAQFSPQYTELGLKNLNLSLYGNGNTPGYLEQYKNAMPALTEAQNQADSLARKSTFADLAQYGPGGVDAIRSLDPGGSSLMDRLRAISEAELKAGGRLMPEDQRRITSGVRADWSNRGLGASDPAQLAEAMQLYGGGEQTKAQRFARAAAVADQSNRMYANPILAYMGLGSGAGNQTGSVLSAGRAGIGSDPTVGNLAGYANTMFGQNYSGKLQKNLYNAGVEERAWGNVGDGVNSLLAGFCWGAREIFGTHDVRWLEFRDYILHRAPAKLRDWYKAHAQGWAERLRTATPETRAAVKRWMERRIATA